MTVIVTDTGFGAEEWTHGFTPLAELAANESGTELAVDLASDEDPMQLHNRLSSIDLIRIDFPVYSDGRGFTTAAILRRMGFQGRLRAKGHVLADQYAMARRSGFDELEIDQELATRQPEEQWLARADWQAHNYQARLRA